MNQNKLSSRNGTNELDGTHAAQYKRFIAIGIGLALALSLLLTPLGFETRSFSTVTVWGLIGLSAYSIGFVLSLVSLALLKRKRGSLAAAAGAIGQFLFYPIILIDLSGNFSSLPPPAAIPPLELATLAVSLVTVFLIINARVKRML